MVRTGLGGLPTSIGRAVARKTAHAPVQRTSRTALLELLRRKGWQVEDIDRHPVLLGVPLGQDGGPSSGISVDIGLKNMTVASVADIADASSEFKEALVTRALDSPDDNREFQEILRGTGPIPMVLKVKEDMMKLPIATALHPSGLQRGISREKQQILRDPFFRAHPPSAELFDLIVEAVPGADATVEAREEHRREQRAAMNLANAKDAKKS